MAAVAGWLVAVWLHFSGIARRALYPLLVATQAIPIVILAPVLVLWLGFGLLPKLIVIALVCFFPIVVTTLSGLETVDPDLIKLLRTFDASRRVRRSGTSSCRARSRGCSPAPSSPPYSR